MILDGGGVFERVSANSEATLKLLILDVIVFIGGGESAEVTVGLDIVTKRIGVTVIPGDFSINFLELSSLHFCFEVCKNVLEIFSLLIFLSQTFFSSSIFYFSKQNIFLEKFLFDFYFLRLHSTREQHKLKRS